MFYNIFSSVPKEVNSEYVAQFDYWLATLPERKTKNITVSTVCGQLGGNFFQAEYMLEFARNVGILSRHYLVYCPVCGGCLDVLEKDDDVTDTLLNPLYCCECDTEREISPSDIYSAYKVVRRPDASNHEIEDAMKKRMTEEIGKTNFTEADSLHKKTFLYNYFYSPDESAYAKFKQMRECLDKDYGDDKTAKGAALENLVCELFKCVAFMKSSTKVRNETNQFDCTVLTQLDTSYPSIFNYMSPMFLIECKNEKKIPGNTYVNKIIGIMEKNETKLGILFTRRHAAVTCNETAYNHYLTKTYAPKQEIVICMDDTDLDYLIDKRVNLLEYLNYKISKFTSNAKNMTWEMFTEEQKDVRKMSTKVSQNVDLLT